MPDRSTVGHVLVAPAQSAYNAFVNRFAAGLVAGGFRVQQFCWYPWLLLRADVAILHWPNEFFGSPSTLKRIKAAVKLCMLRLARRLGRLKLIWVAHNAQPHDLHLGSPARIRRFFDALDGIIYLSHHSRRTIHELYLPSPRTLELIIVHGHYRDEATTPPQPLRSPQAALHLACFGQIRPYKNIEELIACVSRLSELGLRLTVAGAQQDAQLAQRIVQLADHASNIRLDVRPEPLPEADLEAIIDAADGVVLPYREILNSGAALYALSRNRPVLMPRLGSLPELQAAVGTDWVYLYDGALSETVLVQFAQWMRQQARGAAPDLSAYDWGTIHQSTCEFVTAVRTAGANGVERSAGRLRRA